MLIILVIDASKHDEIAPFVHCRRKSAARRRRNARTPHLSCLKNKGVATHSQKSVSLAYLLDNAAAIFTTQLRTHIYYIKPHLGPHVALEVVAPEVRVHGSLGVVGRGEAPIKYFLYLYFFLLNTNTHAHTHAHTHTHTHTHTCIHYLCSVFVKYTSKFIINDNITHKKVNLPLLVNPPYKKAVSSKTARPTAERGEGLSELLKSQFPNIFTVQSNHREYFSEWRANVRCRPFCPRQASSISAPSCQRGMRRCGIYIPLVNVNA